MGYPVKLMDLRYILKTTTYNNYNKASETLIHCIIATCCEALLSNSVKVSVHRNPGMHAYGTSHVNLNASPDSCFPRTSGCCTFISMSNVTRKFSLHHVSIHTTPYISLLLKYLYQPLLKVTVYL